MTKSLKSASLPALSAETTNPLPNSLAIRGKHWSIPYHTASGNAPYAQSILVLFLAIHHWFFIVFTFSHHSRLVHCLYAHVSPL